MRVLTDKYFVAFGTSMCYYIFRRKTNVFLRHTFDKAKRDLIMADKYQYYVLDKKAVPDVLLKVVDAKRLLESGRASSVQEATDQVGISRSSFYKYKDDIFPFHDDTKGKTITWVIQMDDESGLLSDVLKVIADYHANILTIHQSIPINGIASLTISVETTDSTGDITTMMSDIEEKKGIHYVKVLAKE